MNANTSNLCVNLLRESERRSSSPVRWRVMMPICALLGCVGCLLWWLILIGQLFLVRAQLSTVRFDLTSRKTVHATILSQMATARELEGELEQLSWYACGRQTYGAFLARLADVMPSDVQLTSLAIPEPAAQNLAGPNPKAPPLPGPADISETISLRMMGRTTKDTPVEELMKSLTDPAFTNVLKIVKDPRPAEQSPRIHSFRQDLTASPDGKRFLTFDIEYKCVERRFGK